MKRQLIIACLVGLSINNFAQDQSSKAKKVVIDNATLKCYYLFSKKKEGMSQPYCHDTMALDIGNKMSKFYDPARSGRDSLLADKLKNLQNISHDIKRITILTGKEAKDISNMPGTISSNFSQGESYQIYKDRNTNQVKVLDHTTVGRDIFFYEDQLGSLPWKISNEKKTILSYTCQKASLHFRGRDYIAWFTQEIPVSDGPWKFMGLPGLILQVEDTQQLFSFTIVGLQHIKNPSPIFFDNSGTMKCSRGEFEGLKKMQVAGKQFNFGGGDVVIAELPGNYDYLPMELE